MGRTTRSSVWRGSFLGLLALIGTAGPLFASLNSAYLTGGDALWPLSWIAWAPMGFLILRNRPGNGVGIGLLFIGATMGLSFVTGSMAALGAVPLEVRTWLEVVNVVTGVAPWIGIVWLLLVFPDGSYRTRAEKWVGRLLIGFGAVAGIAFALSPEPMFETGVPSPLALPAVGSLTSIITSESGFYSVVVLTFAALVLLVQRWRRSESVRRAQFRWLFFGAFLFFVEITLSQFLPDDSIGLLLWIPAGLAIPITIGIAVLRYRLFEIDRLISRTLGYGLVITLLAGIVLLLVTVFTWFLPSNDPLVVAVATLAAAASFNPVRRAVQARVDRRFNRSKYDSERVVSGFVSRLGDKADADSVVDGWVDVVSETMQPASLGVWVKP